MQIKDYLNLPRAKSTRDADFTNTLLRDLLLKSGFKYRLYAHQLDALHWLLSTELTEGATALIECKRLTTKPLNPRQRCGGVLADDMGMGKTISMLALLSIADANQDTRTLIVCPGGITRQWQREVHNTLGHIAYIHEGPERRASFEKTKAKYNIVSYDLISRDLELLNTVKWTRLIFDEAHFLRNLTSRRFHAAMNLEASRVWFLTGTPINNSTKDLRCYARIIGHMPFADKAFDNNRDVHLFKRLYVLARDKSCLNLPPLDTYTIRVQLPAYEQLTHTQLAHTSKQNLNAYMDNRSGEQLGHVLSSILRQRQYVTHPLLLGFNHYTPKFDAIAELIRRKEGKIVVFSEFIDVLRLVKHLCDDVEMINYNGELTYMQRDYNLARFKESPSARVLLAQIRAGGVGLTIVEATTVIIIEPQYNPVVELQATNRVHRIGQSRAVEVYRFIVENTIETRIEAIKHDKIQIAQDFIKGTDTRPRSIDTLQALVE